MLGDAVGQLTGALWYLRAIYISSPLSILLVGALHASYYMKRSREHWRHFILLVLYAAAMFFVLLERAWYGGKKGNGETRIESLSVTEITGILIVLCDLVLVNMWIGGQAWAFVCWFLDWITCGDKCYIGYCGKRVCACFCCPCNWCCRRCRCKREKSTTPPVVPTIDTPQPPAAPARTLSRNRWPYRRYNS